MGAAGLGYLPDGLPGDGHVPEWPVRWFYWIGLFEALQ